MDRIIPKPDIREIGARLFFQKREGVACPADLFFFVSAMSVKRHEEKLPNCGRTDGGHHRHKQRKLEAFGFFSTLFERKDSRIAQK